MRCCKRRQLLMPQQQQQPTTTGEREKKEEEEEEGDRNGLTSTSCSKRKQGKVMVREGERKRGGEEAMRLE